MRTGLGADLLFSESSSLLSAIRYCRSASQNIVTLVVGNACTTLSHGAGAHSRAQGAEMHGPFGTAVHSVPFKSPVTTLTVSDFGCSNLRLTAMPAGKDEETSWFPQLHQHWPWDGLQNGARAEVSRAE